MHQSKLIQLLSLLTPEEIKRFDRFMASPYFNTSDKLLQFYRNVAKHYPGFKSPKLEKEKMYRQLHGKGSKYNDQTMRELISDTIQLVKTFTAHEQLQKDELEFVNHRYLWLTDRNADKLREAENQLAVKLLEKRGVHDSYYYRHQWIYDYHNFEMLTTRLDGAEYKLLKDTGFSQHVHSLNRYYLMNFFEVNIYLMALAKIYNQPVNEALVEHIDMLAKKYAGRGDASIDVFYNCFQLLRTDDEKYYTELKKMFFANNPAVSLTAQREAGVTLENYCIKRIREGEDRFGDEVIDIYRFEVEHDLYLENGKLSYTLYQNIAGLGAEGNRLDWVEEFVEKYRSYLPAEYGEEVYCYARAHILFARKRYREALRQALASHTMYFFWHKILVKNLVARAQYELGMFDQLQVELESYKHHLADDRVSEVRRKNTQLFISALRQLCELNLTYSREGVLKLKAQVAGEKLLLNKGWFSRKIEDLEKRKKRKN